MREPRPAAAPPRPRTPMRHPRIRTGILALAFALLVPLGPARADSFGPDPVEALRRALEPIRPAARKETLEARAKELRTLSDLARALLLREWRLEGADRGPYTVGTWQRVATRI